MKLWERVRWWKSTTKERDHQSAYNDTLLEDYPMRDEYDFSENLGSMVHWNFYGKGWKMVTCHKCKQSVPPDKADTNYGGGFSCRDPIRCVESNLDTLRREHAAFKREVWEHINSLKARLNNYEFPWKGATKFSDWEQTTICFTPVCENRIRVGRTYCELHRKGGVSHNVPSICRRCGADHFDCR